MLERIEVWNIWRTFRWQHFQMRLKWKKFELRLYIQFHLSLFLWIHLVIFFSSGSGNGFALKWRQPVTKYGVTMNKCMPTSDIIFFWQNVTKHKATMLELVLFLMKGTCLCGYKHSSTSVVLCILFQNISKHLSMLAMPLLACGFVKIHKKLGVHFNVAGANGVSAGSSLPRSAETPLVKGTVIFTWKNFGSWRHCLNTRRFQ